MTRADDRNLCEQAIDWINTQPLTAESNQDALQLYYWVRLGQPVELEEAAINTAKRVLHEGAIIA